MIEVIKYGALTWLVLDGIAVVVLYHAMKHAPFMDDNGNIIPDEDVVIDLRDHDREEVNA